jgi:formylglycine-generating enzyme required for sulfatase activity
MLLNLDQHTGKRIGPRLRRSANGLRPVAIAAFFFGLLGLAFSPGLSAIEPPVAPEKLPALPQREIWQEPNSGIKFVKIPDGCFQMGQSPVEKRLLTRESGVGDYTLYFADEAPQHEVCLDEFWMGIHEVTQGQWQKIMGFNPSAFPDGPEHPVEMVSWDDTQIFIEKLNKLNEDFLFRLPSEAEWEYAARAGTTTMFNTGDTITGQQANFNGTFPFGLNLRDEYRKNTTPVGSFPPNAFGIYDMHGNVWEWCDDWYQENYYRDSPHANPRGPKTGTMKVLRGGSWYRYTGHIRSATRYKNKVIGQYGDTGFRLVQTTKKAEDGAVYFNQDF